MFIQHTREDTQCTLHNVPFVDLNQRLKKLGEQETFCRRCY
jgi:hypothetical protein